MSPEERQLLEETLELSKENNKILRKMRRHMVWGTFFRLIYWAIFIGTAIGLYYYLQPYLDQLIDFYAGLSQRVDNVQAFFESGS